MPITRLQRKFPSGGASATVNMPAGTQQTSDTKNGSTATADWTFNTDGTVVAGGDGSNHDWIDEATPFAGAGDDYEIRATLDASSGGGLRATSDDTGVWLSMDVNRFWGCRRNSDGTDTAELTIDIRDVATQTIQDTGDYHIEAVRFTL